MWFAVFTAFAFALLYGLYRGTHWMHEVYTATNSLWWRTVAAASTRSWRIFALGWRAFLAAAIRFATRALVFTALVPVAALIWVIYKSCVLMASLYNSAFTFVTW